jgi:hypothetical protein
MRRSAALLAVVVSVTGTLTSAGLPAAAAPVPGNPVVLVSGLNNPRQLSLLGGRGLLIAEAGRGDQPTFCVASPGCGAGTGSIARIDDVWANPPTARRIVTGLLSFADPDGGFAVGADGVSTRNGTQVYIAMTADGAGLVGPTGMARRRLLPDTPVGTPGGGQLGKLLLSWAGRTLRVAADISAVEAAEDPDGAGVDSNPYAVLALPDGRQLVADAAGNDILSVRGHSVDVFAVLPDHDGQQAVPTSLALGPDGSIYVGELNGESPTTARIDRLSPTGDLLDWVGGFSTVTGVAVGPDGTVYASELFGGADVLPGQVTAVPPTGMRRHYPVPFPAGLAVDGSRHLYVSAWSISDADGVPLGNGVTAAPGQVWRLTV